MQLIEWSVEESPAANVVLGLANVLPQCSKVGLLLVLCEIFKGRSQVTDEFLMTLFSACCAVHFWERLREEQSFPLASKSFRLFWAQIWI